MFILRLTLLNRYPTTINLTYKGQKDFRSFAGGLASIAIYLVILLMTGVIMNTVITKGNTSMSINEVLKDIYNDPKSHYFAKSDIYFAFKLIGPTPDKLLDKNYFSFEIKQISYVKTNESSTGYTYSSTLIEYEY